MPLNAQLTLSILAHESSSGDLSRSLRATPVSYAASIADGTGANQAQVVWSATRTLSGASETLNLAALADTRDGSPATVTITAVKVAYIRNKGASAITVGGLPITSVAAGAAAVHCDPSAAGLAAGGVTVTGTVGGTYDVVLIGEGSVA